MVALPEPERLDTDRDAIPHRASLHAEKADRLFDSGILNEASREYDAALRLDPDNSYLLNNRGATLARLGRLDDALRDFDHAVALNPKNPAMLRHKAFALVELSRIKEALATLEDLKHPTVDDARKKVLRFHLQKLAKSGFASWRGGKPTGSNPRIPITPGPPVSDYVIEDRQ